MLYLPALKRVKRISSSNRSGSFMGSEFAYEDMSAQEVERFTYRYLRDEPCGDLTCTVSERIPVDRKSGYRRQLVWHDRDELRVRKVEYYDRKDAHLKTLTLGKLRTVSGSLLVRRRDDDGQSSHGEKHRIDLDGLSVPNRPRRTRLQPVQPETRALTTVLRALTPVLSHTVRSSASRSSCGNLNVTFSSMPSRSVTTTSNMSPSGQSAPGQALQGPTPRP